MKKEKLLLLFNLFLGFLAKVLFIFIGYVLIKAGMEPQKAIIIVLLLFTLVP